MNDATQSGEPPIFIRSGDRSKIVRYRDFNVVGFAFAFASSALLWYAIVNLVS